MTESSSGLKLGYERPDAGDASVASEIQHEMGYFLKHDVPQTPHVRSLYLRVLVEVVDEWLASAVRGYTAPHRVEQALCVEKRLCRFVQLERRRLNVEHRTLVWSVRCKLIHLYDSMHVVDGSTRRRYGQAWYGTVAELACDIDRDDARLAQWFADQKMLPLRGPARFDSYGILAFWKTLVMVGARWQSLPYDVWAEAAVRRLKAAAAVFVTQVGPQTRYNHVGLCERVEPGSHMYRINAYFVKETERTFFFLERTLAQCAGFRWQLRAPLSCYSNGDEVRPAFNRWTHELIKGSHSEFVEEDFRDVVYDFSVRPGELDRFVEYDEYEKQEAQACISRRRPTDYDALRTRLVDCTIDRAWEACCTGPAAPEYMLLASIAIDYGFQALFNGIEFNKAYFHTTCGGSYDPYFKQKQRSPRRLFTERDINAGTLHYYYRLRFEEGMRMSRAVYDESMYPHPVIVRTMNGHHVATREGLLIECGHFADAFCEWLCLMCEDPKICGRLTNTESLMPLYRRLMPLRAMNRADDIERVHDETRSKERPQFTVVSRRDDEPSGAAKRAYQYM